MRSFFEAYKKYIIKHPKKLEYKPTNFEKFQEEALYDICNKIIDTGIPYTEADTAAIQDFVQISSYIHRLYAELYQRISDNYLHLNLKGCDIAEYIVAGLNREYKVIYNKRVAVLNKVEKGTYFLYDMMNFKLQSPVPEVGLIDVRACLESATDSTSLLLNYLRHFLDKDFVSKDFKAEEFAGRIKNSMQISQMAVTLKHSYDDILCNGGFVRFDNANKLIVFDYENHNNLKLLLAGDMMFSERRLQVLNHIREGSVVPRLFKYVTNYRIKRAKINNGSISLDFGQGNPKDYKQIVSDMQSAVDSYYEFLVGDTILPNLANCTIDEVISAWCAIQYIAWYISTNINYDISIQTKEDYFTVPSKILKKDLLSYIVKLTGIKTQKIKAAVIALEADWTKYNDIWSSVLYPIGEYYLLPFFPIIYSSPYNVIDRLLFKGGFNLDDRGVLFEKYLYNKLTHTANSYPAICMPAGRYGIHGDEEEIDMLISMKKVILIADAKCIHYSVEPLNYSEAWSRLEEGCEQVIRKAEFVKNNPQYFEELGD